MKRWRRKAKKQKEREATRKKERVKRQVAEMLVLGDGRGCKSFILRIDKISCHFSQSLLQSWPKEDCSCYCQPHSQNQPPFQEHIKCSWLFLFCYVQFLCGGRLTILTSSILEKLLCGLEAPYHFNIINLGEAAEEDVDIHHRGRICITDREHILCCTRE